MTERPLDELVAEAWPRAQAQWSSFLALSEPALGSALPAIAQIHLGTRQIELDADEIRRHRLEGCIEALLAHEVGHHVRYPGTLAVQARMRLLERSLIPYPDCSLINPFTDLMINEQLGAVYRDRFVEAYHALTPVGRWHEAPLLPFYLTVYEEIWQLPPGHLLGEAAAGYEAAYPGFRADAQLLAQDLFHTGPNLFTQFLFFASVALRYLVPAAGAPAALGPPCSSGEPSAADWAEAITPSAQEREAIARALREGWIRSELADRLGGDDARERRIAGLPGAGSDDARKVPEVMAAYYRQEAERHLFRVPTRRVLGEAVVPTTVDDWEPGDPVRGIDWQATLRLRGEIYGAAQPLRRDIVADHEGLEQPTERPRMELYLDVSGSMPNPIVTVNLMTLAAQVLAIGALRAEGAVRALLYSGDVTALWSWCRSELEISQFLLHYVGGGTQFPFGRLAASVRECGREQPHRVILTDRDFDRNIDASPAHDVTVADAAAHGRLVLLQLDPAPERVRRYEALGAAVVAVGELDDFPRAAAGLVRALFDDRRAGASGGER
ncbi:MAG TPA: hypothetical protein VHW23_05505 [Kofleriaceae bacterium]|nr:hypothetical protein [Kofleriaceae bacterium]